MNRAILTTFTILCLASTLFLIVLSPNVKLIEDSLHNTRKTSTANELVPKWNYTIPDVDDDDYVGIKDIYPLARYFLI